MVITLYSLQYHQLSRDGINEIENMFINTSHSKWKKFVQIGKTKRKVFVGTVQPKVAKEHTHCGIWTETEVEIRVISIHITKIKTSICPKQAYEFI